jgi:hypothetical protein
MRYLTLEEIKKQCVIDSIYEDDDMYLTSLGETAEEIIEQQIDIKLEEVVSVYGKLPSPLRQAMLMMVENLYNNRGSMVEEIPPVIMYFMKMYRQFN